MQRKTLSVVLIMSLLLTLLAACGGKTGGNEPNNTGGSTTPGEGTQTPAANYGDTGGLQLPLTDKPVTLTWMLVSDVEGLNTKLIATEIEKRTGIKLEIQAIAPAIFKERLQTTLASGKLPDLFHGLSLSEVNKLGALNAIAPINKHIDKLPNFKKLYTEENPWVMKSYSDDKGNMYAWPIYKFSREVNHGFLYRKDVFEANNIKMWNTTDEFYQAMKALKEKYPASYPYASKTKENIFMDWAYGWGIGGTSFPAYYDEGTKQWSFSFTSPKYKEMLDFIKKMYDEGLIDPEFLTDTAAGWQGKMTTGKSFVTFDWIGRLDEFSNAVQSQIPGYDLRYANPVGPTGNIRTLPDVTTFGLAVANNDKQELAFKLLDYLSSPSGAELVTMGIEGVSYTKDSNNNITYPELKDVAKVDIKALEQKYGLWLEGMYLRVDPRSVYFDFTDREQEAQDLMVDKKEALDPVLKFTDEETATIAELRPQLLKAANEFAVRYILTKNQGDAQWQEWLNTAKKMNEEKYIKAFNDAQKRFDSQ